MDIFCTSKGPGPDGGVFGPFLLSISPSCWRRWLCLSIYFTRAYDEKYCTVDTSLALSSEAAALGDTPERVHSPRGPGLTMRVLMLRAGLWLVSVASARTNSLARPLSFLGGVPVPGQLWAGVFTVQGWESCCELWAAPERKFHSQISR